MAAAYGVTVNVAVWVTLPDLAVIVTVCVLVTAFVVIVKVCEVEPEPTVTLLGTVATAVLLLVRVAVWLEVGAAVK